MRTLFVILTWCAVMNGIQAQKIIEKHISFAQKNALELNLQITDSINVHTWNKNEVYAKASVNINENKDNDVYETSFGETGDRVVVKANFRSDYFKGKKHCCESEISWDIYLPENAQVSIETINGNIVITGKTSQIKAHTISGFIDLSIPAEKKADLEMKTISGNIYTDVAMTNSGKKRIAELHISDKLNGGGVPINLETISGDIFFRKAK